MRWTARAILYVTVPATIITSDWRGEKRITSDPKREISNRLAPAAMSSIAQQARPIGIGQREFLRNQFKAASNRVWITSPSIFELYPISALDGMLSRGPARIFLQTNQRRK